MVNNIGIGGEVSGENHASRSKLKLNIIYAPPINIKIFINGSAKAKKTFLL